MRRTELIHCRVNVESYTATVRNALPRKSPTIIEQFKSPVTSRGVSTDGANLIAFHLPQLRRESGTHLLLGDQREFLKNPVHKLSIEPGTFSTSEEGCNPKPVSPLSHKLPHASI